MEVDGGPRKTTFSTLALVDPNRKRKNMRMFMFACKGNGGRFAMLVRTERSIVGAKRDLGLVPSILVLALAYCQESCPVT